MLCKACHWDICSNEQENGQYIEIIVGESSFNNHIQTKMDTPLAQTHGFIDTIANPKIECILDRGITPGKDPKILNIDSNKCRKNILYYQVKNI